MAADKITMASSASASAPTPTASPATPTAGSFWDPFICRPPNCTLTTPNLRITQVYGVNVPTNPGGQYLYPDVIVAASGSFSISIAASTATSTAASTATCTAALPFSVSVGAIRANW